MIFKKSVAVVVLLVFSVPAIFLVVFFYRLSLDMQAVEARAMECDMLIPAVVEFKGRMGRFPSQAEADQLDPKLRAKCSYYNSGQQFSMGLTGGRINAQVYGYNSDTGNWYWD